MSELLPSTSGIDLYTADTPNGAKISIALNELSASYPDFTYTQHTLDLSKGENKKEWYVKINPNGRIPAIVDRNPGKGNTNVWETSSILLYLAQQYDQKYTLHFDDQIEEQTMLNWIFFAHGGIEPTASTAVHFINFAEEKLPYAQRYFIDEGKRLLTVYETRLAEDGGRDFLVGAGKGKFSLADIVSFTWPRIHLFAFGIPSLEDAGYPLVAEYIRRIEKRTSVAKALQIDL